MTPVNPDTLEFVARDLEAMDCAATAKRVRGCAERWALADRWMREQARHSLYCCWEDGRRKRELVCTCGLIAALADGGQP